MTTPTSRVTTQVLTGYRWVVAPIGHDDEPHSSGRAGTHTAAWTAALAGGRAALLAGELDTLAVHLNGQLDATYDPGRDEHGQLDEAAVTRALVDLHQAATASDVADIIARTPGRIAADRVNSAAPRDLW